MLFVFPPIFVADTEIIYGYNFVAPLKHLLLFEICTGELCEKFVYKHSETMEYVRN